MDQPERKLNLALASLRVILGVVFVVHGAQKLLGWFGGGGISGTAEFFGTLGLIPTMPLAVISGAGELVGGLMVLFGLWMPIAAVVLTIDMVVAIIFRTIKLGFISGGGVELNLLILAIILALVLLGPGRYSLADPLMRRRQGSSE